MIASRVIRPREVPPSEGDFAAEIHPVIRRILLSRGIPAMLNFHWT